MSKTNVCIKKEISCHRIPQTYSTNMGNLTYFNPTVFDL